MPNFPIEQYLESMKQRPPDAAYIAPALAGGMDAYSTARDSKAKSASDAAQKLISAGFELVDTKGNAIPSDQLISFIQTGKNLPNMSEYKWVKTNKDEQVTPETWQLDILKKNGLTVPPGTLVSKKWLDSNVKGSVSSGNSSNIIPWADMPDHIKQMGVAAYEGRLNPLGNRYEALIESAAEQYSNGAAKGDKKFAEPQNGKYVAYTGKVRSAAATAFDSGKQGQNALALDTAISHAGDLYAKVPSLLNLDAAAFNKPMNILKKQFTDNVALPKFEANAQALVNEMTTAFKGSGATNEEIAAWRGTLNSSMTPNQIQEVIKTDILLLGKRLEKLQYSKNSIMSGNINERTLISPASQSVLDGMKKSSTDFASEAEAEAANLPRGTRITIGGRPVEVQ